MYVGSIPTGVSMEKNTVWTYTRPQVGYFPRQDRYVLYLERRNKFWDWVSSAANRPFRRSDYDSRLWGSIWDWSYHKSENKAVIFASFKITKDEAEKISPGIGDKLDLGWLTQSSDEL